MDFYRALQIYEQQDQCSLAIIILKYLHDIFTVVK